MHCQKSYHTSDYGLSLLSLGLVEKQSQGKNIFKSEKYYILKKLSKHNQ